MWVFTLDGFYSAVVHKDDPELVVVRARKREDLVSLRKQMAPTHLTLTVLHTPDADYAYRMVMPRQTWSSYLMTTVMDMDYPNFKDAVSRTQGWRRSALYHDVWAAMMPLQQEDDA
jgi:hypothetical protein